jgi:ABC-type amino acid transport substrate-binding protein
MDCSKPNPRRARRAFLAGLLMLVAGGCAPVAERPSAEGPLRVGVTANYPPVVFREGGEIVGLEADFAARLGRDLGRPVELVEVPWEGLIPALRQRRIDVIMSGMSITQARAREVAFTRPYMRTGQMALVRRADAAALGPPGALQQLDLRVGYERGTTGALYVRTRLPKATPVPFDGPELALTALRAGQIDVLVHDAPTIWRLAGDDRSGDLLGLFRPLTDESLAWALRPEDRALRQQLNAALNAWSRSGELEGLLNRWMRVRVVVD